MVLVHFYVLTIVPCFKSYGPRASEYFDTKYDYIKGPVGWRCSFPGHNFILFLLSILNFIAESRSEILFSPNPVHEFEFYSILTSVYFIISPKF